MKAYFWSKTTDVGREVKTIGQLVNSFTHSFIGFEAQTDGSDMYAYECMYVNF